MIERIATVEMPQYEELQQHAEQKRGEQRQRHGGEKVFRDRIESDSAIRAEHVLHAMRKIDEVHRPRTPGKIGRDQKKKNAELHAVRI